MLYQRIKAQIDSYYKHVDPTPGVAGGGYYFGPTVCNLVPGPFTVSSEKENNHASPSESCGNPVKIETKSDVDYHTNWLGIPTGSPDVVVAVNVIRSSAQGQGTLEDGYRRGAIIAATACYYQQVASEIRNQKRLTIPDSSACHALAEDLEQKSKGVQTLKGQLAGQRNVLDIYKCDNSWDAHADSAAHPDVGPLRQSAQQLCAEREAIEAMFAQLAACEVFSRAQSGYQKQIGSSAGQAAIENVRMQISNQCSDQCQNSLHVAHLSTWDKLWKAVTGDYPSNQSVDGCVNPCYKSKMPDAIKGHLENLWPSTGNSCAPYSRNDRVPGGGAFFAIGMLQIFGRRKRRGLKSGQAGKAAVPLIVCAFALWSAACGPNHPPATYTHCGVTTTTPPNGDSLDCDCQNQPPSPAGSGGKCSNDHGTGGGAIGETQIGAAEAGNTGATANKIAGDLNSSAASTETGGQLAQGQAASDGGVGTTTGKAGKGDSSKGNHSFGGPRMGNRGGGAGGGAGGGGMNSSFGNLSTAPSVDGVDGVTGGSGDKLGGNYLAGAAAQAGDGLGGQFRRGSGNGLDGEGGGATEENFTPDGGAMGDALTIEDPDDYFTRVGLNDNLFKIVERRYRKKSTAWTTESLHSVKP
jgi:hypothetical protein